MRARDVKGTKSNHIVAQHGKVLPKKVYVKWMIEQADAPWLEVDEDVENLAEKGETIYVGEYRLMTVRKVQLDLKVG